MMLNIVTGKIADTMAVLFIPSQASFFCLEVNKMEKKYIYIQLVLLLRCWKAHCPEKNINKQLVTKEHVTFNNLL